MAVDVTGGVLTAGDGIISNLKGTTMRYWISWIQRTQDSRPLNGPPNSGILGWWCSGEDSNGWDVLCAAVEATDAGAACAAIFKDWPEAAEDMAANGWRIFEHDKGDDWRPSDRFPLSDWMKERFGNSS